MKKSKLTKAQEQCLRDQVITADQPGPVLRDFRVLLEFLGPEGVEAGGKYNLLPLKSIGELDRRLSRPLHLELKRPQLRSHPYLQGLNLLLRASGLSRVEGTGAKARLVLDPAMLDAVGPAQPHGAIFQLAGSLAPARPRGDGRGTGLDLGGPAPVLPASLAALPENGLRFDPEEAPGSLPPRGRPGFLHAGPDGPVRAPGGRAAASAGHDLEPGRRQARSVRRCRLHPARCGANVDRLAGATGSPRGSRTRTRIRRKGKP